MTPRVHPPARPAPRKARNPPRTAAREPPNRPNQRRASPRHAHRASPLKVTKPRNYGTFTVSSAPPERPFRRATPLPGEEDRGFFQHLPLHLQRAVLPPQPTQLLQLLAGQSLALT